MSSGITTHNRDKYERVRRLMWIKCEACGRLVFYKDYKNNHYVCPRCGRAFMMTPKQRLDLLFDNIDWKKFDLPIVSCKNDRNEQRFIPIIIFIQF